MLDAAALGNLPRPGDRIDRYEVIAPIAHGGMAAVFAARRSSLGGFDKLFAIKVLLPHLCSDRHFVDMFLDEARIAAAIQHANVVQVFDVGEHAGSPFLVMEFLRGQTFARVLRVAKKTEQALPVGFGLSVLAQAAEGLEAAHQTKGGDGHPLGIVHRDVSPQNIHVGYDGRVKVVDFGIAAARGRITETRTGEMKGKVRYLAPEQITRAAEIDRRTDLWAIGVMGWEMFAKKPLFAGADDAVTLWNILHMPVPDLQPLANDLPASVATLLMQCLERNLAQRPAGADRLAEEFGRAARALDFDRPQALAAEIDRRFVTDKKTEDERLAAAVEGRSEMPLTITDVTSRPTWPSPAPRATGVAQQTTAVLATALLRVPASGRRAAVLVGLAVAIGIGVLFLRPSPAVNRRAAPTPVAVAVPALARPISVPIAVPETARVPPRTVRVPVDPRARLVLVDGQRHDERPLRIGLLPDTAAAVELVGPSGTLVRFTVRAENDGQMLALPANAPRASTPDHSVARRTRPSGPPAQAAPPARRPTVAPSTPSASSGAVSPSERSTAPSRTLVHNPY